MTTAQNALILEWKGSLTIEHAGTAYKELVDAFNKNQPIYLDISKITDMDSSIIQLICSAFKEAHTQEKEFHLTGTVKPQLQTTLVRYGFLLQAESSGEALEKQWCIQNQGAL